jgi:PadR family transcriptional regulator, regulatory protein PadR
MRLADRGLLGTAWESAPRAGCPPRHLYRLTGPGRALAGELPAPAEREAPPATSRVRPRPSWEGA